MEKIKWSENVTNEKALQALPTVCREANWSGHILKINCFLHDGIEGSERSRKKTKKKKTTSR